MTMLIDWFKRTIEALLPKAESNAWDDYRKARAMELAPVPVAEKRIMLAGVKKEF